MMIQTVQKEQIQLKMKNFESEHFQVEIMKTLPHVCKKILEDHWPTINDLCEALG